MLVEEQLPVEVEASVPPVGLGLQQCGSSEWGEPQVNGRTFTVSRPVKMKKLSLVMLQDQRKLCEQFEKDSIRPLEYLVVVLQGLGLDQ